MTAKGKRASWKTEVQYKGDTYTLRQWSKETGISTDTLCLRYHKHEQGLITLDDVFAPTINSYRFQKGNHIARNQGAPYGKRVRAIEALFDAFLKEGVHRIPEEMRVYMDTGKIGNAMNFYLKYQAFFPKDKIEALDGEASKNIASVAVVFNSDAPAPTDITIIDQ